MPEESSRKTVKVVVLGDIGRSPRMQYHALSLANNGFSVNIISYVESTPLAELLDNPNIAITQLNPLILGVGPKLVQYALKAFWQAVSLLLTLFVTGKCDYLLCQNPPAIPTLPVCRFYCLLTKSKFVIDWHNYGYTIMALTLPPDHFLLKLSKWLEKYFGQSSQHNFCVTYAMREDLISNWSIDAKVLYDRPPKIFRPLTIEEKHKWFVKISQQYPVFSSTSADSETQFSKTAFTQVIGTHVELRPDRPGLLFSSTSWTPDEDFGILMEALQVYETSYNLSRKLPKLVCVITGKGPMKQHYIDLILSRKWENVTVVTPWLEAQDYPKMVGSADLGVCLHTSSSGLDLPMKVVDMFGAGLPVSACHYKCIDELVVDGSNGFTFTTSDRLAKQIVTWFEGFPTHIIQNQIADGMRRHLAKFQETRWEDNWNERAKDVFQSS